MGTISREKDIVDVPTRVEKDTQHLIVHMAQVWDTVDVPTRVEKDTQHLIVHMAQVKDIVGILAVATLMERVIKKFKFFYTNLLFITLEWRETILLAICL